MKPLVTKIARELKLNETQANSALKLLFEEECTIPFVARYRKEVTGSMDEVQLRELRDRFIYRTELEEMKDRCLKVILEQSKTNPSLAARVPELQNQFQACDTKQQVEDLYLPFKPKRRTRGQIAKAKGLEALLEKILKEHSTLHDLIGVAAEFVTPSDQAVEKELEVASPELALAGAADILAEIIHETASYRSLVRELSYANGMLCAKKNELKSGATATGDEEFKKKKTNANKYENYFDYKESIATALPHRIMAVRRGEAEKVLRLSVEVDSDLIVQNLQENYFSQFATPATSTVTTWLEQTIRDAYRRLIAPAIETEIRLQLKNRAEEEAIKVFSTNLEHLLLLPPIPGKTVLGIDPGLRTGSKLAIVAETGKLLAHTVIYPQADNPDSQATLAAKKTLAEFIQTYQVSFIAIGNGTGSKEIDLLVIETLRAIQSQAKRLIVNEAGASVYSTDEIAREEFPDLDPTIRSAVSIARRLQDPLAELVKIDPRSIGVGQYQHDCNLTKLNQSLKETVESCVNRVGVNLNTASYKLLSYVSGISANLARNIVTYREQNGSFQDRLALREVSGFGPKTFQQAAGFLRIPNSSNPLDNSAVHPERYAIVEKIAKDLSMPITSMIGKKETIEAISLEQYVGDDIGLPTLTDIAVELVKPGRDPREDGSRLTFSDELATIEDLKVGMKLKGTVSNVTNFGAFVDIGVHQDGLIHVSELAEHFVKDPATVVAVGDVVDVYVLDVDLLRKRISLSRKQQQSAKPTTAPRTQTSTPRSTPAGGMSGRDAPRQRISSAKEDSRPNRSSPAHAQMHGNPPTRSNYNNQRPQNPQFKASAPDRNKQAQQKAKHFSVEDLLNKFNSH